MKGKQLRNIALLIFFILTGIGTVINLIMVACFAEPPLTIIELMCLVLKNEIPIAIFNYILLGLLYLISIIKD